MGNQSSLKEIAIFGNGCFWCTEAIFQKLKGVISVKPGYSGGTKPNPSYEEVCNGNTGHAEVIKIEYDPTQIEYKVLLEVFFFTHDPTTLNRQGNDVGEQYRSVIFYASDDQKTEAEKFIGQLTSESVYSSPIVTELKPLDKFFEAEDYHRNYYERNKDKPYCQVIINPKLQKFKQHYSKLMKE
jgi:peptide-methionine (S)-S-oxide reductase